MPSLLLTDRRVASLKAKRARVEYFDRTLAGFGLRVTSAGAKSAGPPRDAAVVHRTG